MMHCNRCGTEIPESDFGNGRCDDCNAELSTTPTQNMDDELDRLIEQSSVPNLALLYKRAKGTGLITPAQAYK